MKQLLENKVEIKASKLLKGEVGLFSNTIFDKDEMVIPASQFSSMKLIPWSQIDQLDEKVKEKVLSFCPGTQKGVYIPKNFNFLTSAWYINHSCNPNVGFDNDFNFVAIRTIGLGEELTWDYGFDETNPNFKMNCRCRSKNCRHIITGNDWKFLIKRKTILPYLSPHVIKLAKI